MDTFNSQLSNMTCCSAEKNTVYLKMMHHWLFSQPQIELQYVSVLEPTRDA